MSGNTVSSAQTLTAGIRAEFSDTYSRSYGGVQERLSSVAEFIPSDKRTERYAYYESAPHWSIWNDGANIRSKSFKDATWTVSNRSFGIRVEWNRDDRRDDQTKSLLTRVKDAATSGPLLHERVIFQMMTGATDTDLLPSVPNAADGSALYSSSTRFGASSGNLLTGSGVAAGPAIVTDFFSVMSQFASFQDTEGQPLWDPSVLDGGVVIYFKPANEKVFTEAFLQTIHSYANSTSNAGVSNVIQAAAKKVTLVATPRVTDNDWYAFLRQPTRKPFIVQERDPVTEKIVMYDDSMDAGVLASKVEFAQWDARFGYGIATPYATIKVDN